jgi:hypothetical protein
LITAQYFSAGPSDSISRWTPCPPESCELLSGQRGITPAFGYSAPHLSARGTSTLLNSVLLSTHYGSVRLPYGAASGVISSPSALDCSPTSPSGLPGSSADLSPHAVPNHPGRPRRCFCPLLRGECQTLPTGEGGPPTGTPNEAESGSLALRLTGSRREPSPDELLRPTLAWLHVKWAITVGVFSAYNISQACPGAPPLGPVSASPVADRQCVAELQRQRGMVSPSSGRTWRRFSGSGPTR